jgi:hypothetical protein
LKAYGLSGDDMESESPPLKKEIKPKCGRLKIILGDNIRFRSLSRELY